MKDRDITNDLAIVTYLHCGMCGKELAEGTTDADELVSPKEYQRIQAGWTPLGLQIWCTRHDVNIIHIDFERHKHPANVHRKRLPNEVKPA